LPMPRRSPSELPARVLPFSRARLPSRADPSLSSAKRRALPCHGNTLWPPSATPVGNTFVTLPVLMRQLRPAAAAAPASASFCRFLCPARGRLAPSVRRVRLAEQLAVVLPRWLRRRCARRRERLPGELSLLRGWWTGRACPAAGGGAVCWWTVKARSSLPPARSQWKARGRWRRFEALWMRMMSSMKSGLSGLSRI